jgi:hypothetical protein
MPWWSWVIIWVVLALALLGMLVFMAIRLFRKGVRVLDELGVLASKAELLDSVTDAAEAAEDAAAAQQQRLAILAGAEAMRERREFVRAAALDRKAARHDARIARAKRITSVDANSREWFKAD